MNNAERQAALVEHRERHGLVLVRSWVAKSDVDAVRRYVQRLDETKRRRDKARRQPGRARRG